LPVLFSRLGNTVEEESHRWVYGVFWLQVVLGIPGSRSGNVRAPFMKGAISNPSTGNCTNSLGVPFGFSRQGGPCGFLHNLD
jgi:hypothetical protein